MSAAIGGGILCAVSLVGRTASGRWVAPIPVFTGVWGIALLGHALAGPAFNPLMPLDDVAVLFFVIGALLFTGGCLAARLSSFDIEKTQAHYTLRSWAFKMLVLVVILTVPLAYFRVRELLDGVPASEFLFYARALDVKAAMTGSPSILGPYANIVVVSIAVTLVAYSVTVTRRQGQFRLAVLTVSLFASLLAGGRSAFVTLLVSVIAARALRNELRARTVVMVGAIFLVLFFGVALFVKKGGADINASLGDNARILLQGLRDYALGGMVAFQRVLLLPGEIPSTMGVTRTFAEFANHFGTRIAVPPIHAEYTTIGEQNITNVYTTYFAYLDYGLFGAGILVTLFGFVANIVYRVAIRGNAIAIAVYATLFSGMVMSIFSEVFYSNVNFLAKVVLCGLILAQRQTRKSLTL